VIVVAIPAAVMDAHQQKKIDQIGEALRILELRVINLEKQNKELNTKMEDDIHNHVRTLVDRIQVLENELKSLKK
jgi:chaperonin cofactor prefoldin